MKALGLALSYPSDKLISISKAADGLYKPGPDVRKPDGTTRPTLSACQPLREIQSRIRARIFKRVLFPFYLTGSVPGQDQKTNAGLHIGAKILFTEDIRKFFPSTQFALVESVFSGLFGFDADVSECLTRLTTKDGSLPQGASTSPAISNLVFWQYEPRLVQTLSVHGFAYSRFIDDITVSSQSRIAAADKTWVVARIFGMLTACGCHPHRRKHKIFASGQRMITTKLTANQKPGILSEERSRIRASVRNLERSWIGGGGSELTTQLSKAKGRVLRLRRYHPGKGEALKRRLLILEFGTDSPALNVGGLPQPDGTDSMQAEPVLSAPLSVDDPPPF
jgi:hypothetical protein